MVLLKKLLEIFGFIVVQTGIMLVKFVVIRVFKVLKEPKDFLIRVCRDLKVRKDPKVFKVSKV